MDPCGGRQRSDDDEHRTCKRARGGEAHGQHAEAEVPGERGGIGTGEDQRQGRGRDHDRREPAGRPGGARRAAEQPDRDHRQPESAPRMLEQPAGAQFAEQGELDQDEAEPGEALGREAVGMGEAIEGEVAQGAHEQRRCREKPRPGRSEPPQRRTKRTAPGSRNGGRERATEEREGKPDQAPGHQGVRQVVPRSDDDQRWTEVADIGNHGADDEGHRLQAAPMTKQGQRDGGVAEREGHCDPNPSRPV